MWLILCCIIDDNGDEDRVDDIVEHSEDSTGSDLLLNSDGSPDRIGALNLVNKNENWYYSERAALSVLKKFSARSRFGFEIYYETIADLYALSTLRHWF